MLGAIAGDIIGSPFEQHPHKRLDFPLFSAASRFTDDTVLTVAVAEALLHKEDYGETFARYYYTYPHAGYGGSFSRWAQSWDRKPYNSFGNGSAMRISPVAYAFTTLKRVLKEAERCSAVTHNHPEGIKGAQATAAAIFLVKSGRSKRQIQNYVEREFGYDLSVPLKKIRPRYQFDVSCQGSVPQAIRAFLESNDFESAVRNAVSLGGDSDTLACIAGSIAHATYGELPLEIQKQTLQRLDSSLVKMINQFTTKFK